MKMKDRARPQDNGLPAGPRPRSLSGWWPGVGLSLAALVATSAAGQEAPFPVGQVIEQVESPDIPGQRWALYLPTHYRPGVRWPVLFLLDPRGRALVPLRLVRAAAERHGYVVLSSWNTLSDGPMEPNVAAMNAMLADAGRRLSIDTRRLYLVGFSGTARASWLFADQLRGSVAGVLGFGAGPPPGYQWPTLLPGERRPFVFFGGAGTTDFNYEELVALEPALAQRQIPYRIRYYDSGHAWPPERVMAEAIGWLELEARTQGLVAPDPHWVDSVGETREAEARQQLAAGDTVGAWEAWRAVVADFGAVRDETAARQQVAVLERSGPVRRRQHSLERILQDRAEYLQRLARFLDRFLTASPPPTVAASLKELRVTELTRRSQDQRDTLQALAARRLLEHVKVYSSFYQPRDYFTRGDPARALAILDVAEAVDPGRPWVCHGRAEALLQLGRAGEALPALECWSRGARLPVDSVLADSAFAPFRDLPVFQALRSRLGPSGSS